MSPRRPPNLSAWYRIERAAVGFRQLPFKGSLLPADRLQHTRHGLRLAGTAGLLTTAVLTLLFVRAELRTREKDPVAGAVALIPQLEAPATGALSDVAGHGALSETASQRSIQD